MKLRNSPASFMLALAAACCPAILLLLWAGQAGAVIIFDDGGIHTIDSVLNDRVEVRDSGGGAPTTVNLVNGGDVTGLEVFGVSLANMSGGFVGQDGFFARDSSVVTITGGEVFSGGVFAEDGATMIISNVDVTDFGGLFANNSSTIELSGGSITGGVFANDTSQITISGGSGFPGEGTFANDSATMNITGGSFLFFADPLDVNLFANDTTTINIFGPSFNFPFGPIAPLSGVLTGTLSDGNAVNGDFGRDSGAQIILIEVPEPGTLMLSWIGLLVLGLSRGLCGRYDP